MKLLGLDWAAVFAALPAWAALAPGARAAALKALKPSQPVAAAALGEHLEAALRAGLVEEVGKRVAPRPACRDLLVLLRALDRQRIWDAPSAAALAGYLQEHFTGEEVAGLRMQKRVSHGYADRRELAELARDEEWVEGFLATTRQVDAAAWERARLVPGDYPRFAIVPVWEAAHRMVGELAALPAPVPLRELPRLFADLGPATLSDALRGSLRMLLLFAGLRDADLEPVVGPWPEAAARLRREAPPPVAAVEAVEGFEAAWLMEDMTTVLVAASAAPVPLRGGDGEIFARARTALAARLLALPAWVEAAVGAEAEERVDTAASLLVALELVAHTSRDGRGYQLSATAKGAEWLALSARERLAGLVEAVRGSAERNPATWYGTAGGGPLGFFPVRIGVQIRKDAPVDARATLTRTLLSLPDGFVALDTFLANAARGANPFLAALDRGAPVADLRWGMREPPRRQWEHGWREIVHAVLTLRLAPLGGVRLGRAADGQACFRLTGVGRFLLGAEESFEYGHAAEGDVIVQPNFEVVFLAPAPRVEAQLARFAERVGAGPGVMFRLTRASVLAAAEAGMGEAQVIEALRAASSRELPGNVVRQVGDWMAGVRRVRLRPALLLECPDAETAARVHAAAGKGARALSPTVLELPEAPAKERSALARKLRASGIFVQ